MCLITNYIIASQCNLYISYYTALTVCISLLVHIFAAFCCTVLLYYRGIVTALCCTVDLHSCAVQSYLYIFWYCTVVLVQLRCNNVHVHTWRCTLDWYSPLLTVILVHFFLLRCTLDLTDHCQVVFIYCLVS